MLLHADALLPCAPLLNALFGLSEKLALHQQVLLLLLQSEVHRCELHFFWGNNKWAHKYRVIKATGKWKGIAIGAAEMKKVRLFKVSPGRWPWAEDRLFEDFVELRKVGIALDGPYLTVNQK